MWLQCLPIDDIHRPVEEFGNVTLHADIIEDRDAAIRIEFNQNINVTVRPRLAARHRAKQRGAMHAPRAQAALGPAAMTLAEAEGLDAHRRSVEIRLRKPKDT